MVPNTKCPVSAAVSAVSIVSKSRISPTSTTFGSSRSAARRPVAKVLVSLPTSRWLITHLSGLYTYSIGSSNVIICLLAVVLIRFKSAASVVDLPEPVSPVTKMRPLRYSGNVDTTAGKFKSSKFGILSFNKRIQRENFSCCIKILTRSLLS